jgi:uncharacterized protein (TIGR02599 family)
MMNNLLNTWGYFIQVDDEEPRPDFVTTTIAPKRWRSRLMEFMQPSEKMMLNDTDYSAMDTNWFSIALTGANPPVRTLAENIIALVILPKLSQLDQQYRLPVTDNPIGHDIKPYYLSPNYVYNSSIGNTGLTTTSTPVNPGNSSSGTSDPAGVNPHNQLPPVVQVVMVAIDERSAARLVDKYGKDSSKPIGPDSSSLFRTASNTLETPTTGDLAKYEKQLIDMGATYRIFSSDVIIRGAKWSRASKF